jgi:uncharacterized protein (UPF0332 family)
VKEELRPLLAKAKESLEAAGLLLKEGYADFAASRGYYAMFYVAEALLLDRGLTFSSHSAVIAAFGKEFAKTGVLDARFHRYLLDAQDFRNLGDYGVGRPVKAEQARQVLQWAAEFLEAADQFLSANQGK